MTNRTGVESGSGACVAVVIAAYNARDTIARAVASALAQSEAAEVVVVDDKSTDDTVVQAERAEDGSGRLTVLTSSTNCGPATARNRGIEASMAPIVALLDADDYYLPGRFASLLAVPDWDFVADNIAILREDAPKDVDPARETPPPIEAVTLTPESFVLSCLTRRDRYRGELAFLKPAMRRSFLDAHGLRYSAHLRLAEDFDFYTRALMAGARFRVTPSCRYVAVEREMSLSNTHSVADLERFVALDRELGAQAKDRALRSALRRHLRQTHGKLRHRAFLAEKSEHGLYAAVRREAADPAALITVIAAIARDKASMLLPKRHDQPPRHLRYLIEL